MDKRKGFMKLLKELLALHEADPGFEKMMKNIIKDKPSGKVSIMQAFGSDEYNMLYDMGIRFMEKPTYWEDLDSWAEKHPLTQAMIEKAEKALGVPFKVYTQDKVFGPGNGKSRDSDAKDGWMPLHDAHKQKEPVYIVHMRDGSRYLVDGTQAQRYIRLWAKIT